MAGGIKLGKLLLLESTVKFVVRLQTPLAVCRGNYEGGWGSEKVNGAIMVIFLLAEGQVRRKLVWVYFFPHPRFISYFSFLC